MKEARAYVNVGSRVKETIEANCGLPDGAYMRVCDQAACANLGGETWDGLEKRGRAHMICAKCPVRLLCLREACVNEAVSKTRFYVRGGAYPQDRVRISRAYAKSRVLGRAAEQQHTNRLRKAVEEDNGERYWTRDGSDFHWKSPIWGWGSGSARTC